MAQRYSEDVRIKVARFQTEIGGSELGENDVPT